jgi:glycosyltransferase involved in cell wall biosynthesis
LRVNVLHIIPSVSARQGGPSVAIKAITGALARLGVNVTVATTDDDGPSSRLKVPLGIALREDNVTYFYFGRNLLQYKVSFGLMKWLRANLANFDLVHIHALFSFSSTVAARVARKHAVPYVVRPLGVLNRWGMENRRRIPKLVSFHLVELPILLHSAAIHYTSDAERAEAASLDPQLANHHSATISLPIERAEPGDAEVFRARYPALKKHKMILFLSRIHPMKGLELLMDAFAMLREKNKDVALVIAGEGEESYVRELKKRGARSREQGALSTERGGWSRGSEEEDKEGEGNDQEHEQDDVIWTGHLSGEMKAAALAAADVFVLPSASENFGIAAAESLAAGVPTIVSEEVALSKDIRQYDAGVVVKRDVRQLAEAINDLLSNKERAEVLAANEERLVNERYSPEAVGKALKDLYEEIAMNHPSSAHCG